MERLTIGLSAYALVGTYSMFREVHDWVVVSSFGGADLLYINC